MNSLKEYSLLAATSLIVSLIGSELTLRITAHILPDLHLDEFYDIYSGEPPTHYYRFGLNDTISFKSEGEFDYRLVTNNCGFFDRPFPEKFDDKTIVSFGDSFTQGVGADSTESWPRYLQDCLHEKYDEWSIYNCGLAGCDPFFNYVAFRDLILPREPDHILLCVNETDVSDVTGRGGMERFREDGSVEYKSPSWRYRLFKSSYLFRYLCVNLLKYNYLCMTDKEANLQTEQSIKTLQHVINDFNCLATENGITFTLITTPFPASLKSANIRQDNVINLTVDSSIQTIDMLPYLLQDSLIKNIASYYWPNDGHFTAAGYQVLANGICKELDLNSP